ncbi:MAG: Ig-like domain-containing protein, partial [Lachnospiraceae bacterium]|nr:Ig-like domain-containing protein [Lachnospiraceae bacterium]
RTAASKFLTAMMAILLIFAVCGNVFISASAAAELGNTVYLKTSDTTTPYIHYWTESGGNSTSSAWPGVAMEKVAGETDVYYYDLPCDISELSGIIFLSDGSGNKMTGDLTSISGNLYDSSSSSWTTFDTSAIKIKEFGGDLASPQYTGSRINLYVKAEGGDGNLQYKISVSGAQSETLSDFSSKNQVTWTPTKAGDYTVTFDVKDGSGETNSRQLSYTIKDLGNAEEPVFLSASPANNSQIKKGGSTTVAVEGAGGQINTKLLFYKTEVLDPDGNRVNTVYYQLGNRVSFEASKIGTYTVNMTIQNSSVDNKTTTVTYTYDSVDNPIDTDTTTDNPVAVTGVKLDKTTASMKIGETTTLKATVLPSDADNKAVTWSSSNDSIATVSSSGVVKAVGKGTATITVKTEDGGFTAECKVTVTEVESDTDSDIIDTETDTSTDTDTNTDTDTDRVMGDIDGDNKVTVKDASRIQMYALNKITFTAEQEVVADLNGDGKISMKDASLAQRIALGFDR